MIRKDVLDYVMEKTQDLIHSPSCCKEAKDAAQAWLAAVGTEQEAEATKAYIAELEADIIPIDGLISFLNSEHAAELFGEEKAKLMEAHGREIKAAGAKYCDCPACTAVAAILEKKAELMG